MLHAGQSGIFTPPEEKAVIGLRGLACMSTLSGVIEQAWYREVGEREEVDEIKNEMR